MAKPHKYAWNGLDAETVLPVETVANMAQRAALESTGDILKGKHRIVSVRSTDRSIEFRINDFLISFNKLMVFSLSFTERGGHTFASTSIDWYMTEQATVGGFIPVSTKSMVAHNTFMQFVLNLAGQIRAADATARITVREGVEGAAGQPHAESSPSQPVPPPAPSAASNAVPPPPPPPGSPSPGAVPPPPPPPPPVPATSPAAAPGTPWGMPSPQAPPLPAGPVRPPIGAGIVTGIPGASSVAPPPNPLAAQMLAEDDELESTRLTQATDAARPWSLTLVDGRSLTLRDQAIALGRAPSAPASHRAAAAVAIDDPRKSVSKTHAVITVENGSLWVTDLHSTNGTSVTNTVGEATSCPPEVAMPVGDGWTVSLGEFAITARLKD